MNDCRYGLKEWIKEKLLDDADIKKPVYKNDFGWLGYKPMLTICQSHLDKCMPGWLKNDGRKRTATIVFQLIRKYNKNVGIQISYYRGEITYAKRRNCIPE